MKARFIQLSICILCLVICLPAQAKKKGGGKGATVSNVDVSQNKVILSIKDLPGKKAPAEEVIYTVSPGAKIMVDDSPATLSQVHTGQKVINYTEGDEKVLVELDVEN
ncbi:MAG TPA: hypothetical protein VL981_03425 [Candidatus Methylacidiphilales bacterium]|nr:hypothetical protein [Candidatus Methylacidiphilales bacterium]